MSSKLSNLFNRSAKAMTGKDLADHKKLVSNRLKHRFKGKVDSTFLFILSPPFCGSTLLNQVISTSQLVSVNNERSTREGQTLPEVRKMMFDHDQRWEEDYPLDWKFIRSVWLKYWDQTKPILLEKSPPNIVRAMDLQDNFNPARFIIFHRNPYAHVQSLISRKDPDITEAAKFAIKCLNHQKYNLENLDSVVQISYEALTNDPDAAIEKLRSLVPELTDINVNQDFTAHNFKQESMKITNLNAEKIAKLSTMELEQINRVFGEHKKLLNYFGYQLETTSTQTPK